MRSITLGKWLFSIKKAGTPMIILGQNPFLA